MAQLLPLIGAKATATAGASLATGITTGAAMGKGGIGLLQAIGASPLGGMTSLLPAATPGLTGALPAAVSPGIFAKAVPALGGLKSLTPAITQTPGVAGFKSLAMANAPLTAPSSFGAVNQAVGMGNIGGQAGNLGTQFTKVANVSANTGANTGLLQKGASFKAPSMTKTAGTITERLAPQVSP